MQYPLVTVLAENPDGLQVQALLTNERWPELLFADRSVPSEIKEAILADEQHRRQNATHNDELLAFSSWRMASKRTFQAEVYQSNWTPYRTAQWAMGESGLVSPAVRTDAMRGVLNGNIGGLLVPSVGLHATIKTANGDVMTVRRPDHVAMFPGVRSISLTEGAEMKDIVKTATGLRYDPSLTLWRGIQEELGLDFRHNTGSLPEMRIHTIMATSTGDMGMLAHVDLTRLGVTNNEILYRINHHITDVEEVSEPRFVKWSAKHVNELIENAIADGDYLPMALLNIRNSARADGLQIKTFELPNLVPNLGLSEVADNRVGLADR
jgi:hypothetical protein